MARCILIQNLKDAFTISHQIYGWKHIQNLGLQNHYQDDENFVLWLRMLSALAFVPPNDVIRYFELLIDEIRNNFNDECDDLIGYFEDTYIGNRVIKAIK